MTNTTKSKSAARERGDVKRHFTQSFARYESILLHYELILFEGIRNKNWDQIKGNWKQFSGKVKEKWGKLTDDEVIKIAGQREHLIGYLQERYGYEKEQAERELNEFTRGLTPFVATTEKRQPM